MNIIKHSDKPSHWYAPDGTSRYDANLRVARKEGLYPSVTSITKAFPSDGLKNYIRGQDILAAITTPRNPGENDEDYIERIIACSEEEANKAADVGTRRHKICEEYCHLGPDDIGTPIDPIDADHVLPYFQWFNDNVKEVVKTEFNVINQVIGYGGKVDLHCVLKDNRHAIVDLKNRKRLGVYDSDVMQLAAYSAAMQCQDRPYANISIVLGTQEPSILVHEWSTHECAEAWDTFKLCHKLWCRARQYYPTGVV